MRKPLSSNAIASCGVGIIYRENKINDVLISVKVVINAINLMLLHVPLL